MIRWGHRWTAFAFAVSGFNSPPLHNSVPPPNGVWVALPPINRRKSGVWLSGEVYRYDPGMFLIAVWL